MRPLYAWFGGRRIASFPRSWEDIRKMLAPKPKLSVQWEHQSSCPPVRGVYDGSCLLCEVPQGDWHEPCTGPKRMTDRVIRERFPLIPLLLAKPGNEIGAGMLEKAIAAAQESLDGEFGLAVGLRMFVVPGAPQDVPGLDPGVRARTLLACNRLLAKLAISGHPGARMVIADMQE